MKVILQSDVKDLGKVGQVVSVAQGYARNFLFPRKLAVEATEKRMKEWNHLQKVAEIKKKKAQSERQTLIEKLKGVTVTFKLQASEDDKLFGSVGAIEVSKQLSEQGFEIDKRDIQIEEAIKVLGQHKAVISLGEGLEAEISVAVERA
jgi:large subunit ribosomal protein L9